MILRSPKLAFASILLLSCLLIQPVGLDAQCVTDGSPNVAMFGTTVVITKYLTAPTTCTGTVSNAFACLPSLGEVRTMQTYLGASAQTMMSTNPSCAWNCGCGSINTNAANDGLPVELMDFAVEG